MLKIIYSILTTEKHDEIIDILEDRGYEDSTDEYIDVIYKPRKAQIKQIQALGIDFKINRVNLVNGNVEEII